MSQAMGFTLTSCGRILLYIARSVFPSEERLFWFTFWLQPSPRSVRSHRLQVKWNNMEPGRPMGS